MTNNQFFQVNVYGKESFLKKDLKAIANAAANYVETNIRGLSVRKTTAYLVKKKTHLEVYLINDGQKLSTVPPGSVVPQFIPHVKKVHDDLIIHVLVSIIDWSNFLSWYLEKHSAYEINCF